MGSYRIGIAFTKCHKCEYDKCIVDVWDEDYSGMTEAFYCIKCNPESTNEFIRQHIIGKLQSKIYHMFNDLEISQEEKIAKRIIAILNYEDINENNELINKISGLEKFDLHKIFDFDKVRSIVKMELNNITKYSKMCYI